MKDIIIVKQGDKALKCYSTLTTACKRLKLKVKPQTIRQAMCNAKINVYVIGDIELQRLEIMR